MQVGKINVFLFVQSEISLLHILWCFATCQYSVEVPWTSEKLSLIRSIKQSLIFCIIKLIFRAAICMKQIIRLLPLSLKCFPDGTAYRTVYYAAWVGCTSKSLAYIESFTGKIRTIVKIKLTLWRWIPMK